MKKQLLSILALIICLCTVFTFASCSNKNNAENGSDGSDDATGNGETFDLEDGLEDVDPTTAEDIFAQMKTAYKATIDYSNAYAVSIDWVEEQTDTESGKGASATTYKYVTKEKITADPAATKFSKSITNEDYEDGKITSSTKQSKKVYSEGGKNYIYSSITSDGQPASESYNTLSTYGLAAEKEAMLMSSLFGIGNHFTESFGDPFSASSASDLKTIHNTVINEVKANQKALYEAEGYTVKQLNAKADVIFNKNNNTNILKRTITIASTLQNDGGTYQKNLTIESLLKTKDGKILSFTSTSTQTTSENLGSGVVYETKATSSLAYNFTYSMNNNDFNAVKTSTPSSGVTDAPDYFEVPLNLIIAGNEVSILVVGEASADNTVANILENTLNELFADTNIDYDGKWYTDAACTKEFNISSVTSIDKLKTIGKLYNAGVKVNGNYSLVIDSGKTTVNMPKNYTIVFGDVIADEVLMATASIVEKDNEVLFKVSYMPSAGYETKLTINKVELKYNEDYEQSDFLEDSDGSYFHEFALDGGKVYFVSRSNVATKTFYTLDSFYVRF